MFERWQINANGFNKIKLNVTSNKSKIL